MINQTLHGVDIQSVTLGEFQPGPATPANIDPVHYLIQHGYTLLTTCQPASRFWPFQWIEGGWLLALSLLLLATTLWLRSAGARPETPTTSAAHAAWHSAARAPSPAPTWGAARSARGQDGSDGLDGP